MVSQHALLVTYQTPQSLLSSLRNDGYQVYSTDSPNALVQQTERHHPDAIVINLADLDGPTLTAIMETLREFPGGETLPILLTGPLDEPTIQFAFELGADDYVPNDYPPALLIQKLVHLMQQANRASRLRMTLALVERAKQEWEIGVDSLSELICVLGHDGRVIRTNRTLEVWDVGRVQEVRGRTLASLLKDRFPTIAQTIDNLVYDCWAQLQQGIPLDAELYESTSDDYFRLQIRPLARKTQYLAMAEESAAIAILENITNRKLTEQALSEHAAELERRNQDLDAYGHTVAHDLKSPLNLILGYADMLSTFSPEELASDGLPALQKITDSASRMAEMIDQLLLLASTRHATDQATVIEVDRLVTLALDRFEHEITARTIAVEIAATFPPAIGHAPWVLEIFANLIGNAIKYLGPENPNPTIRIMGRRDGNVARFEVQDSGVGIEAKDQARLFQMFSRIHPTLAEGTGLGLSIVHRIVTQQNGTVGVESTLGQGSTFWFTLPHP